MIADSAAGYSAADADLGRRRVLTVEYKLNLLAPAEGNLLIAEGTVCARAHAGRHESGGLAVKDGKKTSALRDAADHDDHARQKKPKRNRNKE